MMLIIEALLEVFQKLIYSALRKQMLSSNPLVPVSDAEGLLSILLRCTRYLIDLFWAQVV